MGAHTQVVFHEWVSTSSGTPTAFYTSDRFCETLGLLDQLAFEVRAMQGDGANPRLEVQMIHSADGVHWMEKSDEAEIKYADYDLDPANPDLNVRVGLDDGTRSTLRFVRLR